MAISIGEFVFVNEKRYKNKPTSTGGYGYVVAVNNESKYSIRFNIERRTETNVSPRRLSISSIGSIVGINRTRSGNTSQPTINPAPIAPPTSTPTLSISAILKASFNYKYATSNQHPLVSYLQAENNKNESG